MTCEKEEKSLWQLGTTNDEHSASISDCLTCGKPHKPRVGERCYHGTPVLSCLGDLWCTMRHGIQKARQTVCRLSVACRSVSLKSMRGGLELVMQLFSVLDDRALVHAPGFGCCSESGQFALPLHERSQVH